MFKMKLQNLQKINLYCNKCNRIFNLINEIAWRHKHPVCKTCGAILKLNRKIDSEIYSND